MIRPKEMKCCQNCRGFAPTEYQIGDTKIPHLGYCNMMPERRLVHMHHYCRQWENNYEKNS